MASFDAARPRTSDEDDDEEEVELKLPERGEEKPWFSVNKCIVGALVLLFLGSLFLSGEFSSHKTYFCFSNIRSNVVDDHKSITVISE